MDGGRLVTQHFKITTHGTTIVPAVYTNDPTILQQYLEEFDMYMLRDTHRFIGLDLKYTADQKKIAVVQLGMAGFVLVFHFCRYLVVHIFTLFSSIWWFFPQSCSSLKTPYVF